MPATALVPLRYLKVTINFRIRAVGITSLAYRLHLFCFLLLLLTAYGSRSSPLLCDISVDRSLRN
jgi:hypothetical protein